MGLPYPLRAARAQGDTKRFCFMQKLRTILFLFLLLAAGACQKDSSTDPKQVENCVRLHRGDFEVVNTKSDPYYLYMNGSLWGEVGANNTKTFTDRASGSYSFKAVQKSGYLIYPTEFTSASTIVDCEKSGVRL